MKNKSLFSIAVFCALGLVLLGLFLTKRMQLSTMTEAGENAPPMTMSVSTAIAKQQVWTETFQAVGSIEPVQGVILETETAGIVKEITFENGQLVEEGELLVQLDIGVEQAQLRAAIATAKLAEIEYERAKTLRISGTVAQSQLDRTIADLEKANADVQNIEAVIKRKTIRAPFSGKVGIRQVNLGQYVPQGAPIVALQSYDKVFVNFTLPQQALARVGTGMALSLTSDAYPDKTFEGEITAVSPQVDPITRTIELQGTLKNEDGLLRAGLFVKVTVTLPEANEVLVIPATAILYAPYGNSVYKIEKSTTGDSLVAKQYFVRIGKRRGDFVSVEKGLEADDEVVSAGAFKLRNGMGVTIHNEFAPTSQLDPKPDNS